jgi:hypothetical protein
MANSNMHADAIIEKISGLGQKTIVISGILILGMVISLIFFSHIFAIAFFLIWLNKIISGYTRGATESFGIELVTMPMVLIGFFHGPVVGFVFGFAVSAFMDIIKWLINPPFEVNWPPLIPSPDSLIDGTVGLIAALLGGLMSFFFVGVICTIAKNVLIPIKDGLIYGIPVKPAFIFNIVINLFLALAFQELFF